eukprot:1189043-Prorocentrum_minimum.AAC.4
MELNLSNNVLEALPESVAKLTALQTLQLGANQLSRIPRGVCEIQSLQVRHCHHTVHLKHPASVTLPSRCTADYKDPCTCRREMVPPFVDNPPSCDALHIRQCDFVICSQLCVSQKWYDSCFFKLESLTMACRLPLVRPHGETLAGGTTLWKPTAGRGLSAEREGRQRAPPTGAAEGSAAKDTQGFGKSTRGDHR